MLEHILAFIAKMSQDIRTQINEMDAHKAEGFDQYKSFQNPSLGSRKNSLKSKRRNSQGQNVYS